MRNRPLCFICTMIFVLYCLAAGIFGERFLKEFRLSETEKYVRAGDTVSLSGRIIKKVYKPNSLFIYLDHVVVVHKQKSLQESQIIIQTEKEETVALGTIVNVRGKLSFFDEARNPGNFDQKMYYRQQKIHAMVWPDSIKTIDVDKNIMKWTLRNRLEQFRQQWKCLLIQMLGDEEGGVLSAVLLGEKGEMSAETKSLYRIGGISHVLAISGLHLSFLGVGMYEISRRLTGSFLFGGVCGGLFLGIYILMVGMTISALRALVMFGFRIGAGICGRNYDSITALMTAVVITIIWKPMAVYDAGFWMSYGAVFAIIVIYPAFSDFAFRGFFASLSIQMVLLPVLLNTYYEIPVYGIFLNVIVLPLMSVLLFCGVVGSFLCVYGLFPGDALLLLCGQILKMNRRLCLEIGELPFADFCVGKPGRTSVIGYYFCLLAALTFWVVWKKKEKKRYSYLAVGIMIGGIMLLAVRSPWEQRINAAMLDVGQGDCFYLRSPSGNSYLIDGGSSSEKEIARNRIVPFLKSQGIRELDCVFVTHGDEDHMNGIREMLEDPLLQIKVKMLMLPPKHLWNENLCGLVELAEKREIPVRSIKTGQAVVENGLKIRCVQPDEAFDAETENETSLVLSVELENVKILLTGDAEGKGEEHAWKWMKNHRMRYDILKVAHHGSKNSGSDQFLKEAGKGVALISVGENNRYGHPHKETLERLEKNHRKVYCTKDEGALIVCLNSRGKFSIISYSNGKRR